SFEDLCETLGIQSMNDREEYLISCGLYSDEEITDDLNRYKNAVEVVAENLLNNVDLTLTPLKGKYKGWVYKIHPIKGKTWPHVLNEIRLLINGYGFFYISSVKEFLASGPYTQKEAVMKHLHQLTSWSKVYGGPTINQMLDAQMRN